MRDVVVATTYFFPLWPISSLGAPPRPRLPHHPTLTRRRSFLPSPTTTDAWVKAPRAFVTTAMAMTMHVIAHPRLCSRSPQFPPCRYFGRPKFYWSTCISLGHAAAQHHLFPTSQPLRLTRICAAFGCLSNKVQAVAAAVSSLSHSSTRRHQRPGA